MVLGFDQHRAHRILVIAPLFAEASKFRRQIAEIMRTLDPIGVDSFCPDLPGCNESLQPHMDQTLAAWRRSVAAAQEHFGATHVLAIRSGSWLAPSALPGWLLAPPRPDQILRGLMRAHSIALRESGAVTDAKAILDDACRNGVTIAGWRMGPELVRELKQEAFVAAVGQQVIAQERLGGPGLWLNAENQFDQTQATALVDIIAADLDLS